MNITHHTTTIDVRILVPNDTLVGEVVQLRVLRRECFGVVLGLADLERESMMRWADVRLSVHDLLTAAEQAQAQIKFDRDIAWMVN